MKKIRVFGIIILSAAMMSFTADRVIRDVKGYNGPIPLEIHIKNNRIVKIVALTNSETRKYMNLVNQKLIPKWTGMKVDKALSTNMDGVSGATISSDAVKENVRRGLKYYRKKK